MMKKMLCLLIAVCLLIPCAASAQTLGFGFVNAEDVALRKAPGEEWIHRLPKDTSVWITDSQTDSKGTLWYKVNVGVRENYTSYDRTGWIMAKFVDADDSVWHDVVSVYANRLGMTILRADGSTESAGRICVINDKWSPVRGWASGYTHLRQAGVLNSLTHFVITEDGTLITSDGLTDDHFVGIPLRLFCETLPYPALTDDSDLIISSGLALYWLFPQTDPEPAALERVVQIVSSYYLVLMRTSDGGVMAASTNEDDASFAQTDWSEWTELTDISTANSVDQNDIIICTVCVGVRQDGTLLAEPQWLKTALSGWTDMAQVEVCEKYVLGLRRDGTVVSLGMNSNEAPDVSSWTDIVSIAAADDYCVGVKRDGTLVFEGDHIFMREGH